MRASKSSLTSSMDRALSRSGRWRVMTATCGRGWSTSTRAMAPDGSARSRVGGMADEQSTGAAIEDFLIEDRTFPPSEAFKKDTLVASPFLYDEADQDWQGF